MRREKFEIKPVSVYVSDEESGLLEECPETQGRLHTILDSDKILLFLNPVYYKAWLWIGGETTTRMMFHGRTQTPIVRNRSKDAMKISEIREGDKPIAFKIMVGLVEEEDSGPYFANEDGDVIRTWQDS